MSTIIAALKFNVDIIVFMRCTRRAATGSSRCLMVNLTPAGIADSTGALAVLES